MEIVTFTREQEEKILEYMNSNRGRQILERLGVYKESNNLDMNIEFIKTYILEGLRGKFSGEKAINKFFTSMDFYVQNNDFKRFSGDEYIPDDFIDYKVSLPIRNEAAGGLRTEGWILGPDGNEYIVKEAEGLRGEISGTRNKRDGLYNPVVGGSVFKFLGEEAAEFIPACDKLPYYYMYSKNFLKPNQKMYGLDDENFMGCAFELDENGNISHTKIMQKIEETIKKKYGQELSEGQLKKICDKLKLQYATQETLKKLIKSMDENLGNTSIVVTVNKEGKMEDVDISPAYDIDLSFLLGEELLETDYSNRILHRVTNDGKIDLKSMVQEFSESVPGYKEKTDEFVAKFSGGYVDQIFDIAFDMSGVRTFKNREVKEKFGGFIMKQVALFKEACKDHKERQKDFDEQ